MKLFYRHFGEGQPVIILHGLLGLSDNWVTIGRRLAEQFEVFIPDQRNHGQSPHSDTFNYYSLADDLLEFIEDHQLINPIIIGHSMGGKVAMNFALEHPSKVDKLIVVDISMRKYSGRQEHMEILDAMRSIDLARITQREEVETKIREKISSEKIALFILKNIYRIGKTKLAWKLNVNAIFDNIENVYEGIDSPYTFDKQTLFVKGGNSNYITSNDRNQILQNFPHAIFKTIENASHWVHADEPEELCRIFSEFLAKNCEYSV